MKTHASICFLLLTSALGVLTLNTSNAGNPPKEDLYVLDDDDNPVKVDPSVNCDAPILNINDLPHHVFFYLYTRNTMSDPKKLKLDDVASLRSSHFDPKKPTKFITHGWTNSKRSKACTLIRDAFLQNGDYNVIVIDWHRISMKPYTWASLHVVKIAKFTAHMIDFLQSQGMDVSNVTIVGHSLGAHIAGLSSYYAKSKAQYIVALDPAGPNFYLNGQDSKVTKAVATYVQVIHTSRLLGIMSPLGHADFYPNGGIAQNGCLVDMGGSCSHARSYHYYAESINSDGFLARSCTDYADFIRGKCSSNALGHMGGVTPNYNVRGQYFLRTNSKSPFARNNDP